jgi:hypothetical protein
MRRHARKMRKYGLQPMVVINNDSPLPDLAIIVICRALWRYRSELAPLFLGLALELTGLYLHLSHPDWWPYVLITSILAAAALAAFGGFGLALRMERIYAATVVLSAGGWLTTATVLGITHRLLQQGVIFGGIILAVLWWAHRRRRARVRIDRKLSAWPDIAQTIGLAGSAVMSAVVDVWGWRARFRLARGQTLQDVMNKVPAIESALGTHRGAVRVYPTVGDQANRFELRVLDIDPHADAIAWPGPSVSSITEPIDLGPFEDATSARVLFLRRHGLFGGIAGSGKSGGINVLLGNLTACRDVVIWGIDLKRGMELQPWVSCLGRLATTPEQAHALLRDAVAILEARADFLAAEGKRVWEPMQSMPALVIIVDEYAELADDAPEALHYSDSIARRGRAVAVNLIAATQRPTQKAMGQSAVRSQMDIRISFRVRERKDVDLILGQGMLSAGWHAHQLDAPGKFFISAPEHDTPRRARAFLLTDETVTETATRHASIRPPLDELSRLALEEAETPISAPRKADDPEKATGSIESQDSAEEALWDLLTGGPDEGIPIAVLIKATGKSRRWVYYQLSAYARAGRAVQISRGRWRAVHPDEHVP